LNLQKAALLAEIVGSIAVVITMVVLIFEVRGTTDAILAGNRQSIAERTGAFALAVAGNPELAAIQGQALGNPVETAQANSYMVAVLQLVQESYFLYRDGLFDEALWRTRANFALGNVSSEFGRARYERLKQSGVLTPEFTQWLDAEIAKERSGEDDGR
jgi:hypothetical protein